MNFVLLSAMEQELSIVDKFKQSLYFPDEMLSEIRDEAARLDRSLSWIVQRAWKIARKQIQAMPSEPLISDDES